MLTTIDQAIESLHDTDQIGIVCILAPGLPAPHNYYRINKSSRHPRGGSSFYRAWSCDPVTCEVNPTATYLIVSGSRVIEVVR